MHGTYVSHTTNTHACTHDILTSNSITAGGLNSVTKDILLYYTDTHYIPYMKDISLGLLADILHGCVNFYLTQ